MRLKNEGTIQAYKWYPKMGNYYFGYDEENSLFQWSKGEYAGALDTEDMLATISSQLPYRDDDIVGTRALEITGSNTVSSDTNRGLIERNTDTDSFTFQIGPAGGRATLTVDRLEYAGGGMLDVLATLRDAGGAEVASGNDIAARSATLDVTLGEGTYTLVVQGGAEGTPSNGFSSYGSLGYYGIDGTISGVVVPGTGGSGGAGGESGTTGGQGSGGGGTGGGTGGEATGGVATGGASTGGTGGLASGGQATGGETGGTATGGVVSGGTGGTATGGVATGGAGTGGVQATGGASTGGIVTGGAGTGGVQATGGASTGGVPAMGGTGGGSGLSGTGGATSCVTPLASCGDACVDLATDPLHCGDCAIACPLGESCRAGLCASSVTGGGPASPAAASSSSDDGGCACAASRRGPSPGWLSLAAALLFTARRRRSRRPAPRGRSDAPRRSRP